MPLWIDLFFFGVLPPSTYLGILFRNKLQEARAETFNPITHATEKPSLEPLLAVAVFIVNQLLENFERNSQMGVPPVRGVFYTESRMMLLKQKAQN